MMMRRACHTRAFLHPQPPLVVVTNGGDVRILETHSGQEWQPAEKSSEGLSKLIKSAAAVASSDLKAAVSTLMGSDPQIWAQAVRRTTNQTIEELSGDWSESLRPFVPGFLIPRAATRSVLDHLRLGRRFVIVEGSPLVGKSNVLRELVQETNKTADFVTLFIEADAGSGVVQGIADLLSSTLNWPVSKDEVRNWLMRLSHTGGPALVLAIDGIAPKRDVFSQEIDDLSSPSFGSALRLVIAVDDTVAQSLVVNSTGRKASRIGRRSVRVPIGPLDDEEFPDGLQVLWEHRAGIMKGGDKAAEFRLPWVLRAVMGEIASRLQYADESLAASRPPLLGLELIGHAREQFTDHELRRSFRSIAQAIILDASDTKRPISLILESLAVYVVRRDSLLRFLEQAEIKELVEHGYLRPFQHSSGTSVLVVRIPELAASEASDLLAIELAQRVRIDAEDAAEWLSQAAANLPLGDIVAAQALFDAATRHGGLPFNLITALVNSPPRQETIKPATKVAMYMPGAGVMNMTFRERGAIEFESGGHRELVQAEPGEEEHITYADFHSWLILSYLAGFPFALENEEGQQGRFDPAILLEVGACSIVLRRPGPDAEKNGVVQHNLPGQGAIVCHEAGIVEPITLSILRFLSSEGVSAQEWIEEAVRRKSLPLLARIDIALRQLASSADAVKSDFAKLMIKDLVRPALSALPPLH
jgi:hypothetical protein